MKQALTMQDIANIAGVSRQAVTNWRRRTTANGESAAFPKALLVDGIERFDLPEIQAYLNTTGRGLNAESAIDAPALAVPTGVDLEDIVTLLVVRAEHSDDISEMSRAELMTLARAIDPHNLYLATEVAALRSEPRLGAYVDALMATSLGPADALARLSTSFTARTAAARGFDSTLIDLVRELLSVSRLHLGGDEVAIECRLPTDAFGVAQGFEHAIVDDADANHRAMARRLALTGAMPTTSSAAVVRVVSALGRTTHDALNWIEDKVINELADREIAIVLASNSALGGKLRGDDRALRSDILKLGGLVAAVALPRGLWKEAHRQSVGLWVLQGGVTRNEALVADLVSVDIDAVDLGFDLAGALEQTGARQYRYGRRRPYNETWTRDTVVPTGFVAASPLKLPKSTVVERVVAGTALTREGLMGFDLAIAEAPGGNPRPVRSLGDLVEGRNPKIHMKNGARIAREHLDGFGSMRVLSADATVSGSIDPLIAAEHYGHAVRTEPGDVVFAVSARPMAVVDDLGGALVLTPSRILRPSSGRAGIGPQALAQIINRLPQNAREWRSWQVPQLTASQSVALEEALSAAHEYEGEVQRRLDAVFDITNNLLEGVVTGAFDITTTLIKKAG